MSKNARPRFARAAFLISFHEKKTLDTLEVIWHSSGQSMRYSTAKAAKKLGLGRRTLARYIAENKVPAPEAIQVGDATVRIWSDADIETVRKILPKIVNGRKTRWQKERAKKKRPKKSSKKK